MLFSLRHSARGLGTLGACSLVVASGTWACNAAESGAPGPVATEADAAATDASSFAADAGDAAVAPPGVILDMFGKAASCSEACAEYGFSCTESCTLGSGQQVIGTAQYTGQPPHALSSCSEPVPASKDGLRLEQTACCCTAPKPEPTEGTLPAKSCLQVCAARGLRCDPAAWKAYPASDAVGESRYRCSGDRIARIETCDAVPVSTLGPDNCVLRSYYCSCLP